MPSPFFRSRCGSLDREVDNQPTSATKVPHHLRLHLNSYRNRPAIGRSRRRFARAAKLIPVLHGPGYRLDVRTVGASCQILSARQQGRSGCIDEFIRKPFRSLFRGGELNLGICQFRTAGGTIGLAQLSAVLESKVKSYLANLGRTAGELSDTEKSALGSLSGASLDSVDAILNLPPDVRSLVQDAFRKACQWSFISLIPWCCVAAILCLFLSTIPEDVLGPTGQNRKDETELASGRSSLQQPQKSMEPWRTVPPPSGLVSLVLWPIRVAFAYLR